MIRRIEEPVKLGGGGAKPAMSLAAPIHLSSMIDLHYDHNNFVVPDLVDDPIVSLPDPIPLLS